MKVIFTDNVSGVATKGTIKNVKNGFFRNYLLPCKKAVLATEPLIKKWEVLRQQVMIEKGNLLKQIEELKRRFEGTKVKIEKKVTKKGTLYGGVKPADIVAAVKTMLSIDLPVESIVIGTPIKTIGAFEVKINLGEGVATTLPIEVIEKTA